MSKCSAKSRNLAITSHGLYNTGLKYYCNNSTTLEQKKENTSS